MFMYRAEIKYRRHLAKDISIVKHPSEAASIFRKEICGPNEQVACIFINCKNAVIDKYIFSVISSGTIDYCPVFTRKILEMAILTHSNGIVLAHNHPSGGLEPSAGDDLVSKMVLNAAKLFEIRLLDHLIVTESGYFSYADSCRSPF